VGVENASTYSRGVIGLAIARMVPMRFAVGSRLFLDEF